MGKIKAIFDVFRAGSSVSDPVAWKRGQIGVNVLVAFFAAMVALLRSFGTDLPVNDEHLTAFATVTLFVVGLFNHGATVVSTDKIGITGRATSNHAGHESDIGVGKPIGSQPPAGAGESVEKLQTVGQSDYPPGFTDSSS